MLAVLRAIEAKSGLMGVGLACLLCLPGLVVADIYKYKDYRGRLHLTDRPINKPGYTLLKHFTLNDLNKPSPPAAKPGSGWRRILAERRAKWGADIARVAKHHELSAALIHAVVQAESNYRSDAVSKKGAVGLMQLMPATAKRFGVKDRYSGIQNLRGGTRYLHYLIGLFENDLRLALAAYNAGENAVIKYGNKIPPYRETREYVDKVMRFYRANLQGTAWIGPAVAKAEQHR